MSLLTMLGIACIIIGIGFIAVSARFFYLGIQALIANKDFKKSIYKRY
jgi:hypothetical protein